MKQEAEERLAKESGGKKGAAAGSSTNPAQRGVAKPTARSSRMDVDNEDEDEASVPGAARGKAAAVKAKKPPAAKASKRAAREETPENSEDDFDVGSPDEFQHPASLSDHDDAGSDEDSAAPVKAKAGAKGKAAAKPKAAAATGRGKAAAKSPAPAAAKKKAAAESAARPAARRAAASKVRDCCVTSCGFWQVVWFK